MSDDSSSLGSSSSNEQQDDAQSSSSGHSKSDYEARLKKMKNDSFVFEPLFLDDHKSLQSQHTCVIQLPSFMVSDIYMIAIDIDLAVCQSAAEEGGAQPHVPEKASQAKQEDQP